MHLAELPPFSKNEIVDLPDGRKVIRMRDRDIVVRIVGDVVSYESQDDYVFLQERKAAIEGLLDGATWKGREDTLKEFYDAAQLGSGMRVLDIGFRDYRNLEHLRKRFGVIPFGVDIAVPAVQLAMKKGYCVQLCDVQKEQPFGGERFDRVLCIDVLEHMHEPMMGLRRMKHALMPKGQAVIQTIIEGHFGENLVHGHCSLFYSPARLDVMLRRAGLTPLVCVPTRGDCRFVCAATSALETWFWRVLPWRVAVGLVGRRHSAEHTPLGK